MKVNIALTAVANLLGALNGDNAGLGATAANVTFGVPTAVDGTEGRNTEVVVTAVEGQGFRGSKTLSYTRQGLSSGAIASTAPSQIEVAANATEVQVLTAMVATLGLIESEVELLSFTAPVDTETNGVAVIAAKVAGLLYSGSRQYPLVVPVPSLDSAIATSDLNSFEAEA